MSFDVYLQRFQRGEPATLDRRAARQALEGTVRDQYGGYTIKTADGGTCTMQAEGLDGNGDFTGCAFYLRVGWTSQLLALILEVARATGAVIVPVTAPLRAILTAPDQREDLPDLPGWDEPVVCDSGEELRLLLEEGYAALERYRRQVLGTQVNPRLQDRR